MLSNTLDCKCFDFRNYAARKVDNFAKYIREQINGLSLLWIFVDDYAGRKANDPISDIEIILNLESQFTVTCI